MKFDINHLYILFGFVAGIATIVIFTLLWVRKILQKHISVWYKIRDANGIESLESVNIEGVEYWLHIRGSNRDNPILLFLHGGPGASNIGWYDAIQRPWENYFTVVQWDQRQAGKSYKLNKHLDETISHDQYVKDAEKMVAYLRKRFNQEKIFLMATSYGTYISMHVIKKHPDWFYAYVAIGQVVNVLEDTRTEYNLLLDFAQCHNDNELASKLEAIKPYPDPDNTVTSFFNNIGMLQEEASRIGKCYPATLTESIALVAVDKWISPHYTLLDNFKRLFATQLSSDHPFADNFLKFNLPKEVGDTFELPIFFFSGVNDFHIPYANSDRWFNKISAPHKEHIVFNGSAHSAYLSEPGEFLIALVTKVLPFAKMTEPNASQLAKTLDN